MIQGFSGRRFIPLVILSILFSAAWARAGEESAGKVSAFSLKIGVVDMSRVFDGYKKRDRLNKALEEFRLKKSLDVESKAEELNRLKDKIELLAPGSAERKQEEENLSRMQVDLEAGTRIAAREVDDKYRESLVELYKDISREVKLFAEEGDFDLILKTEALDTDTSFTTDLKLQLASQKVLYFSPSLDLTDEIVKRLNKKLGSIPEGPGQ